MASSPYSTPCLRRRAERLSLHTPHSPREEQKQQQQRDERCVAILFLAHDGVANPELWERWRQSQPEYASRIVFAVFRNSKVKYSSEFADRYDLRIRRHTTWCSSSIVKATLESLEEVMEAHPGVAVTYVVSGLDVPLQQPEAMFVVREVVTEGEARVIRPFTTVMAYNHDVMPEVLDWSGWQGHEDVRAKLTCHVQWCGLSREHVQLLASADPTLVDRMLKLGNRLSQEWCPDEWVIGTLLALRGVDLAAETIDWTTTDHYRPNRSAPSPITWGDMAKRKHRVFWAPPAVYRKFDLCGVINTVSRLEGNLFFRKVDRLSPQDVDLFFLPPPPITPKKPSSSGVSRRQAAANKGGSTPPRHRMLLRGRGRMLCPEGTCPIDAGNEAAEQGQGQDGQEEGDGEEHRPAGGAAAAAAAAAADRSDDNKAYRRMPTSSVAAAALHSSPVLQRRSLRSGRSF